MSTVELCGLSTGGIRHPDMLWLPAGLWGEHQLVYTPPTHLLWPAVTLQANKLLPGEDRRSGPQHHDLVLSIS